MDKTDYIIPLLFSCRQWADPAALAQSLQQGESFPPEQPLFGFALRFKSQEPNASKDSANCFFRSAQSWQGMNSAEPNSEMRCACRRFPFYMRLLATLLFKALRSAAGQSYRNFSFSCDAAALSFKALRSPATQSHRNDSFFSIHYSFKKILDTMVSP